MFRPVLFMIIFVLVLAGCSITRPAIETIRTVTVTEVERDTVLVTEADEAMLIAWLECDSLNQVVVTRLQEKEGRLISLSTKLDSIIEETVIGTDTVRITIQQLAFVASIDSQAIYLAWKEQHVLEQESTIETVVVKQKKPPWWYSAIIIICVTIIITTIIMFIKRFIR